MDTAILSGSSRYNSSSLRVAKALAKLFAERAGGEVYTVNFEKYDIPFFNGGDIIPGQLTPFQNELIESMSKAKSIIMVTPEYNWFPSAELVNLIHRLGDKPFSEIWEDKVFSFVGVSTGRGGRMPTVQLSYVVNKLINVFGFNSVTNPKVFEVQFTRTVIHEDGSLIGVPEFDQGIQSFVDYAIRLSKRWE